MANGYTKDDLSAIEGVLADKSRAAVNDEVEYKKWGRLWVKTQTMIEDADKPKVTRGPRKKAEAPGTPAAPPEPNDPPTDPERPRGRNR